MARRKVVQKSSKHATRKLVHASKFPADRLPAELIHMVYTYLEPTEAAAFRWAGRVVAEIGLQYLVPTVYLKLNEESYDQLLAISEHPVVSKYVVNLDYETRGLDFLDREQFDYKIRTRTAIPQQHNPSERPDSLMSARARRAYERDSVLKLRSKEQITQKLNRIWSMYEASYSRQKKVEVAKFFPAKTVKAMKQLRNLKRISTSPDDFAALQESMLHLKTMDIAFTARHMGGILMVPDDRLMQREYQAERRVLNLITSAPDLEYLGLTFKSICSSLYLTIDVTIGKFYWSSLKALSLEGLSSDENDLVDFCKRHTQTLKGISLKHMELHHGSWEVTFHRIRRAFRLGQQLDSCKLCGIFRGIGGQKLDFELRGEDGDNAGRIISDYIRATNVGDISLGEYYEVMGLK